MRSKHRHPIGLALVALSLLGNLFTVVVFARQPDALTAFTVVPVWIWGLMGLLMSVLAYFAFRSPLSLFTSLVWFLSVLVLSDEARGLLRFGHRPPREGSPAASLGRTPLRVITCNWSSQTRPLEGELESWQPDIIFIQEMPHPYLVKQLADRLYGQTGDYRYDENHACGVVVRGRITKALLDPQYRAQYLTVRMTDGEVIELANLHLQPAATNLALWRPSCWEEHERNRIQRRAELRFALSFLQDYTPYPNRATLIAGDFNAPAYDGANRVLGDDFTDTFRAVGSGWGNTYHRRFPLHRIDQIHASSHFLPVRSRAVTLPNCSHRIVVSDLLYN